MKLKNICNMNEVRLIKNIEKNVKYYLTNDFYDELKKLNTYFVAGGAILSTINCIEINDIDVYIKHELGKDISINEYKSLIDDFIKLATKYNFKQVYATDNALTFKKGKKQIQLIIKKDWVCNDISDIQYFFDINVCMCAFDIYRKELYIHNELALMSKQASIININEDAIIATLFRIKKYEKKGYKFDLHCQLSLFARLIKNLKGENFDYKIYKDMVEVIDAYYTESPQLFHQTYVDICILLGIDQYLSFDDFDEKMKELDLSDEI